MDWSSPNFHQPQALPLLILMLVTIASMALSPRALRPSQLLLFLGTLYATLKSHRHMAIFALVAAPILAECVQNWLNSIRSRNNASTERPHGRRFGLVFGLLLSLPLLALAVKLKSSIYSPPSQALIDVPLTAIEFLKANQITGNTFTQPNIWSGYLIWALPTNPVYIDGRIDMYGDEFVAGYVQLIKGNKDWREPFDRYGVSNVIVKPQSPLALELAKSSEWQKVFEDKMAIVFIR